MTYDREAAEVVYRAKAGSKVKVFDALEWLAEMCSHVPRRLGVTPVKSGW